MNKARPYPATILAIKAFKEQNRWSNPEVVDICAAEGQIVPLTTVKKACSTGAEALNFDYVVSLEPIVYAFNRRGANIPEPDLSESIRGTSASDLEKALEAFERVREREIVYLKAQLRRERIQKIIAFGIIAAYFLFELFTPFGMIQLVSW